MTLKPEFITRMRQLHRPTMGTEVMSPLLYWLIRFIRARRVLEIGGGYSSLFILKALADNVTQHKIEVESSQSRTHPYFHADYYNTKYAPCLHTIDLLCHPQTSANLVESTAKELQLESYLHFHRADFRGYSKHFKLPFDFVWMDAGSWEFYLAFFNEYWKLIDPDGGIWLIHSTQTNVQGLDFVERLKKMQLKGTEEFELVSFLEPHKFSQNSFTLVRRTSKLKRRVYSQQA